MEEERPAEEMIAVEGKSVMGRESVVDGKVVGEEQNVVRSRCVMGQKNFGEEELRRKDAYCGRKW